MPDLLESIAENDDAVLSGWAVLFNETAPRIEALPQDKRARELLTLARAFVPRTRSGMCGQRAVSGPEADAAQCRVANPPKTICATEAATMHSTASQNQNVYCTSSTSEAISAASWLPFLANSS